MKQCADPPTRKILASVVAEKLRAYRPIGEPMDSGMRRTAKLIIKKPPSVSWLLMVLGTLEPDHCVFSVSYIAPRKPAR